MNDSIAVPNDLAELQAAMAGQTSVLPIGNQTKTGLSRCQQTSLISLRGMSGILEYEPSEFTFTALAGTRVDELNRVLGEQHQYLPFDPMLVDAGATLGGTVASGLSGPGRFRFGGLRDFLLGIRFVSGDGEVINAGGKVVKNAAGFDIPKFLVGSLGRYGVMTEMTFKVFPRAAQQTSLTIQCRSIAEAIERMSLAAASRWELDAIDYLPEQQSVLIRLSGPEAVNLTLSNEVKRTWGADVAELDSPDDVWRSICELNWGGREWPYAAKVPCTPSLLTELDRWNAEHDDVALHVSVAGGVAWVLLDSSSRLNELGAVLRASLAAGLVVRGESDVMRIGHWAESEISSAVKLAMDPHDKFPGF
ncbi:MAG: FAD-binding protein [Rubripirellula sp.]